ncbi:vacuolar sorting protein SNF8 [Thraustotheca clavata]|uniref:Vacuolar sorting protein SNF8 n=1 Tax=Thraustotheca clavata TaxID=74557 RepID=A0A1V9Z6I4_9STRA|nr:vacuolar sorting protein SNF8 [Thraustotheca clavata]
MRRGKMGIGAVKWKQEQKKAYEEVGTQLNESHLAHVQEQLDVFKTNLQAFAIKYKSQIKKDAEFRQRFQVMCSKIGVDPLASQKGFWSELLDMGDFYYELGVQIIEVCIVTRPKNGGLISIQELLTLLAKKRGPLMQKISQDDIKRSVKKLRVLGEGFQVIELGSKTMIVTVPVELSQDHSSILLLAQETQGIVTTTLLAEKLGWDVNRSNIALNVLLRESMVWIDEQNPNVPAYYFPSIVMGNSNASDQ